MQYNSFNTKPTFFQKLRNFDYILLICILLLGLISALSMYSTDGGEILFHSKSHISKFLIFFTSRFSEFLSIKSLISSKVLSFSSTIMSNDSSAG